MSTKQRLKCPPRSRREKARNTITILVSMCGITLCVILYEILRSVLDIELNEDLGLLIAGIINIPLGILVADKILPKTESEIRDREDIVTY